MSFMAIEKPCLHSEHIKTTPSGKSSPWRWVLDCRKNSHAPPATRATATSKSPNCLTLIVDHRPAADLWMRQVVVIPARAPDIVVRIDDQFPFGVLHVAVHADDVATLIMPFGGPLVALASIDVS